MQVAVQVANTKGTAMQVAMQVANKPCTAGPPKM